MISPCDGLSTCLRGHGEEKRGGVRNGEAAWVAMRSWAKWEDRTQAEKHVFPRCASHLPKKSKRLGGLVSKRYDGRVLSGRRRPIFCVNDRCRQADENLMHGTDETLCRRARDKVAGARKWCASRTILSVPRVVSALSPAARFTSD